MNQLLFEIPALPKAKFLQKKKQVANKKASKKKHDDELKKIHHTHPQYKDTMENSEKHIKNLSRSSLDKLGRNLDVIREQMEYAFKKKKYPTYELLNEWEKQHITARVIKFDKGNKNGLKNEKQPHKKNLQRGIY